MVLLPCAFTDVAPINRKRNANFPILFPTNLMIVETALTNQDDGLFVVFIFFVINEIYVSKHLTIITKNV
jgi:hypothetical protein